MSNIFKCEETMPDTTEFSVGPRLAAGDLDRGMADVPHPPRNQQMATQNIERPRRGHEVMK